MFSDKMEWSRGLSTTFFILFPIPLNHTKLPQINIYYVNFDKPIIIRNFAR